MHRELFTINFIPNCYIILSHKNQSIILYATPHIIRRPWTMVHYVVFILIKKTDFKPGPTL